jgi:large conductance mechanosensitive channel
MNFISRSAKSLAKEFKEFAVKGNVIDLAVGIIVGGAFSKIVSSLVADIITPLLGLALTNLDFKDLKLTLKPPVGANPALTLNYGMFVQNLIDFVIVAFAIFALVKAINALRKKKEAEPPAPPTPPKEQLLLTEIRDTLKEIQKTSR